MALLITVCIIIITVYEIMGFKNMKAVRKALEKQAYEYDYPVPVRKA